MCQMCAGSLFARKVKIDDSLMTATRRRFIGGAAAAGAAIAAMSGRARPAQTDGAEMIFRNGTIIPMTPQQGPVEALAIGGGEILAVGSTAAVSALRGRATTVVDLQGRTMLPGLIDPHHHTVLSALVADLLADVGYPKYRTRDDVVAALTAAAGKTTPGQWIRAGRFDNLLQGGDLSMKLLDAVSTEHPIFVWYVNGHTAAANSTAFKLAKIPEDVGALPGGGRFGRRPNGKLNGLIYEEPALLRFTALAIPDITPNLLEKLVTSYTKRAAATGNTTLHEPGTIKAEWVQLLARLSTTLDIRLSASLPSDAIEESKTFASLGTGVKARVIPGSRFSLYGIKFWADGSNQQETAAQTMPYLHTASRAKRTIPKRRWRRCVARR